MIGAPPGGATYDEIEIVLYIVQKFANYEFNVYGSVVAMFALSTWSVWRAVDGHTTRHIRIRVKYNVKEIFVFALLRIAKLQP